MVIGLETHVELSTESKIFCSCGGHSAAKEPNDCVCPACSGMPGMLPVMNKKVVELAVTAGLMLNCEISRYTTFDKKNYYYPDLPCAYQITQLNHPICTNGCVTLKTSAGERDIHIKQIHMEEDAGKLVHMGKASYVDFNRTSVPLIEIVTQPDFRSAEEVLVYLNKLKSMFRSGGISECEEGAMRCDVNISVRPEGSEEFGVRTEIKNMASFEAIEKAIRYEVQRHIDAIEFETEELVQETRRYDDATGKTFAMRNKETEADYRYFPDANLMPIIIDDAWLEEIKAAKPVAVDEKADSYREAGISEKEIDMLIHNHNISKLLDDVVDAGAKVLTYLRDLESQGYRVNLYIMMCSSEVREQIAMMVKVKDSEQYLNITKTAYPIVNPDFLRRHFIRLIECEATDSNFARGYGAPIYRKSDIQNVFDACRLKVDKYLNFYEVQRNGIER